MTKIAIVTPSLNGGGAEKVAVNLANYYAETGCSVDLVTFSLSGPYKALVSSKVKIVDLKVSRLRYAFFKIRSYLKHNTGAVIISVIRDSNVIVGLASVGLKVKFLAFREASTINGVLKLGFCKRSLYINLMRLSYKFAAVVIANSDDTKIDLVNLNITKSSNTTVIGNPVLVDDYLKLANEKVNEEWLYDESLKVVLAVGRLHALKNFSFLISVFRDVYKVNNSARLMIVGEGQEKSRLLDLISAQGLSGAVKIVDFQTNIYPYYQNSDVFALTSEWEGFGNVLVEALAVGLPIVSTNCPGGPKMILKNGQYGSLVPVGDREFYIQELIRALENSTKRKDSIIYASNYTVENVAEKYLETINYNS